MFNYKILRIKDIKDKIDVRILSKPYQYIILDAGNIPASRWLLKVQEVATLKTFLMLFDQDILSSLRDCYLKFAEDFYKIIIRFGSNKLIGYEYDSSYIPELISEKENLTICKIISDLMLNDNFAIDENQFAGCIVDESWIKL